MGFACVARSSQRKGHRFNANKLLLDPYARLHVGSLRWNDACYGYQVGAENTDLSFDERDSAPFVPKCVVVKSGISLAAEHDTAARHAVESKRHLRIAREGLHETASDGAEEKARDVCGAGAEAGDEMYVFSPLA